MVNTDNPYAKASVEAMHEIFGKDTGLRFASGRFDSDCHTQFDKDLKIPSIMMGMGLARR